MFICMYIYIRKYICLLTADKEIVDKWFQYFFPSYKYIVKYNLPITVYSAQFL